MADNSVLLHKLEPMIKKALSSPRTVRELERIIGEYIDRNAAKLSTSGPLYRTVFLDDEYDKFYRVLDINPEEVKAIIKQSTYIGNKWHIMNKPFNSMAAFCIRYFLMKKDTGMMNGMVAYLTLSMYPSLHSKYFKYEPNAAIMDYTIAHLSNKFKVKNSKTIYNALIETTMVSNNTYSKNLIRATDKDITDYIQAFVTRLNSLLKKIAIMFYKNEKEGLYLNAESESHDEENYRETDNDSLAIERIANGVVMKLAVNGPDMRLIRIAASYGDVSRNDLRNAIVNLCTDSQNRDSIKEMVSSIIYLFIFESHHSKEMISSNDFTTFCLSVYKQANTNDKNVEKIKKTLDSWLNKYSATYKKSNRVNTLSNFRRALYSFIVFTIQQSSRD